jgi:hypothetical protein
MKEMFDVNEANKTPNQTHVDDVLYCGTKGGIGLIKTLLKMFYLEGRAFAQTEESVRWQLLLRDLEPYKAASILWTISNMDNFVLDARDPRMDVDNFLSF